MARSSEEREREVLNDVLTLLDIKAGRRLFLELFEKCNLLGPSFAGDATQTAFNEGVRSPGIWLKSIIEAARPGEFARLLLDSVNLGGDDGRSDHDSERWDE